MHRIEKNNALVVADDLRSTLSAMDEALLTSSRMVGSVIETARASSLPPATSQPIISAVADGFAAVVQGRANFVDAMKRMNVVKRASNLEPVDLGCDNPLVTVFTTARRDATADIPIA